MKLARLLAAAGASGDGFDHAPPADRMLAAAVNSLGEFDDAKLQRSADLKLHVAAWGAASPQNGPAWFAGRVDELAFYINAYHALTTAAVVEADPLPSVGESALTRARFVRFAKLGLRGKAFSLEDLENQIRARADGK